MKVPPVPDPLPAPALADLLEAVEDHLRRFVVFPNEYGSTAVALWIAYTHAVDQFDVAPYLLITAPEIESGKTRVMEVAAPLVSKPMFSSSMTPAVLFRTIDRDHPTMFIDEADNVWTGRKDEKAAELVALLNAGHRRGMKAQRMGGAGKTTLQEFDVFGPKAIAGAFPNLGDIPEALRSRSLHLRMKRKLPDEMVDRWTRQTREAGADVLARLRDDLAQVVLASEPGSVHIEPVEELSDRDFDIWEPLLAVAQRAGGRWPSTALDAALALCAQDVTQELPLRVVLLQDLAEVWDEDAVHMLTDTLLERLHKMPERMWGDYYGSPITAHKVGRLLNPYGVVPKRGPGPDRRRGYFRQDLEDLWARYLPQSVQAVRSVQEQSEDSLSEAFETAELL